jgi:hypothetical protein
MMKKGPMKGMKSPPSFGFSGSAGQYVKKVPQAPTGPVKPPKPMGFRCGGKAGWK